MSTFWSVTDDIKLFLNEIELITIIIRAEPWGYLAMTSKSQLGMQISGLLLVPCSKFKCCDPQQIQVKLFVSKFSP